MCDYNAPSGSEMLDRIEALAERVGSALTGYDAAQRQIKALEEANKELIYKVNVANQRKVQKADPGLVLAFLKAGRATKDLYDTDNKITVIKLFHDLTGLGLKESKDMIDGFFGA